MPQQEVMEVLEEAHKPLSASEIIRILKRKNYEINEKKVFTLLTKMIKFHEIKTEEVDRFTARKKYNEKVNRRLRLYYV